jgi:hypothetical protein
MYELDESLLAPEGSQVQCTKCQHVFTAFPPGAKAAQDTGERQPSAPEPGERAAPGPAPSARGRAAAERGTSAAAPRAGVEGGAEASGGGEAPTQPAPVAPARNGAPRPTARSSTPAVYRPPVSSGSAPAVGRAPVLRRNSVGSFEARLRWSARWRWLAPGLALALAALVAAAFLFLRQDGDRESERARTEALALLALDDAASVEQAAARLSEVLRRAPELKAAAADRALALAVRAAGLGEERDALAARLAARNEERERLPHEAHPGLEAKEPAAVSDVVALEAQLRASEERARELSGAARDQLRAVRTAAGDTPEVVRAAAVLHVIAGERDALQKLARAERDRGRRDAWVDLAEGWMDARDPDRAGRERALVRLGALASARPDLLRGRYLLARAEASLGRRAEAISAVDGVLAANTRHEGARRLREELTAPASAPPAEAPPTATPAEGARPPAVPVPAPRKTVPQAGAGTSPRVASPPPQAPPATSAPDAATAPPASPGAPAAPGASAPPPAPNPPPASPEPPPQPAPQAAPAEPAAPPAPPPAPRQRRGSAEGDPTSGG